MRKLVICLIVLISASVLHGQTGTDSLFFADSLSSSKGIISRFDKQLNTYNLNSIIYANHKFGRFFFSILEDYNSTLIKSVPRNIKDEQNLAFMMEYQFFPKLSSGILLRNQILSDSRRLGLNEASEINSYFFTKYVPLPNVQVKPYFGYSNNRQIGENDGGFIYGADGAANGVEFSDFKVYSSFRFNNTELSPRKNTLRNFNLSLFNNFEERFRNVLSTSYENSRKDFYFTADSMVSQQFNLLNNIQSRTEQNYVLQNRLSFISEERNLLFDLSGRVIWRDIDRDTRYKALSNLSSSIFDVKVQEFRLEFESSGRYRTDIFDGSVHFIYSERDEKHLTKKFDESNIFYYEERRRAYEERSRIESQKNNKALRGAISFTGSLMLSRKDSLSFSVFHNKLTYDTPSDENFDDRDELLSIMRLQYSRKLTPFFTLFINAEGNINHTVYIFSERSSNNNYQRIAKLSTGGNFRGKHLSSKNQFEVSANYTVYDYEDLNPNFKSFSFRQLSVYDSTTLRLNRRLYVKFYGYLKYSKQGEFRWAAFEERPVRDIEEVYLEPKLNYIFSDVVFGIGMRYLRLENFIFSNKSRALESDYKSIGPLSEILYNVAERLEIRVYGWLEFIQLEENRKRQLANLNVQMNWKL